MPQKEADMKTSPSDNRRYTIAFSIAGSLMLIVFFIIVNTLTSRQYPWFIYTSFVVLWWPLSVIFAHRHQKAYAAVGSIIILLFLLAINLQFSPSHLWVLYPAAGVLCWPVILFLGKRAGRLPAALLVSLLLTAYYVLVNALYSPAFPWSIFPVYAVAWWPLAVGPAKEKRAMLFSIAGTLWSVLFFVVLNAVTTPGEIWAVYPIFAFLWWPLSVYCFVWRKNLQSQNARRTGQNS
jgi:hypothetical protein